ncbi:MAG: YfcE family phosphodiesterase [Alphaproteobacteria bacterium]|nr:YfcE family phosphodiesterase [Alphaproteobacteria bacterium]
MRILVISDSHGDSYSVKRAIAEQPSARVLFYLGDGEHDLDSYLPSRPDLYIHKVKGNCDFGSSLPTYVIDEIEGVRVYATHGYVEQVKYGTTVLEQYARDNKVVIALYGHTHNPVTAYSDGIWLINPGSIRMGEYAVVDITPGGIMPILMKLK